MTFDTHRITKKCELCDTTLEMAHADRLFRFTMHTPELCKAATVDRIRMLERAMVGQFESIEHAVRRHVRDVDAFLAERGIETLSEHSDLVKAKAALLYKLVTESPFSADAPDSLADARDAFRRVTP
jgi:hypothetical protein